MTPSALDVEVYLHLIANRRLILPGERHVTRLFVVHMERELGALKPKRRQRLVLRAMGYTRSEITQAMRRAA